MKTFNALLTIQAPNFDRAKEIMDDFQEYASAYDQGTFLNQSPELADAEDVSKTEFVDVGDKIMDPEGNDLKDAIRRAIDLLTEEAEGNGQWDYVSVLSNFFESQYDEPVER